MPGHTFRNFKAGPQLCLTFKPIGVDYMAGSQIVGLMGCLSIIQTVCMPLN